ncbi:Tfp pilus assembly protein, ATPase [Gottschalkia purinilytica]|uniref:Tfp pilus assembly protein, ATPase n=1 Tax=Gottschalkia purinilytica TaxID=1503 RepID=A0A0L0W7D5_GOTPU|nr:pilus assembly protein PilM [Gottschalkia purinilytica]KNF07382.1 Tfp pilus assembly protein, ATPase [Gottschalkia purinilytica]
MHKKAISLDIGNELTNFVLGRFRKDNTVYIDKAFSVETPKDSYNDGIILDFEVMETFLKNILIKNDIKEKRIIFTIKSSSIITKEIELPKVHDKYLKDAVEFEFQRIFPINLDKYVLQFRKIEDIFSRNKNRIKIYVAALSKDIIDQYLSISKALNLIPISLDITLNSSRKIFEHLFNINDKNIGTNCTFLTLELGYNITNISIISKGLCSISRGIPIGFRDIDDKLDINKAIFIETWLNKINSVISFYNKNTNEFIDKLYVYGKYSNEIRILNYLRRNFHFEIESIESIGNVIYENLDLNNYINAIGAFIRR